MPLLAKLIDDSQSGKDSYGAIYAIVQTAVSLAYGLGPFVGGHLVTRYCTTGWNKIGKDRLAPVKVLELFKLPLRHCAILPADVLPTDI